MKSLFKGNALLVGIAAALATTGAAAQEFRYSAWVPPHHPSVAVAAKPLLDHLEKASNGAVKPRIFAGGQLFSATTTLGGVRDGAVDAGFTVPLHTRADLPVNLLFAEMSPFADDPLATAAAINETTFLSCPQCLEEYRKNNAVFLGSYAATPYTLVCNREVKGMSDLRGQRIITSALAPWVEHLGSAPLTAPPADQVNLLQRGQAACSLAPKEWLKGVSLMDAAKVVVDHPQGVIHGMSIMTTNLNSWQKFSPELRQAAIDKLPEVVASVTYGYMDLEEKVIEEAKKKGIKFVTFGEEFAPVWSDFQKKFLPQVIESARQRGVTDAQQLAQVHLDNLAKWQRIMDKIGRDDREAYIHALREEIFSKVKL
jgi:TRAP-type C4-dicarboxylate transport system substrate-binding protein